MKIHIYIGLLLLFFIWLFGFSGLLLNHHWKFASFWEERVESTDDRTITLSTERNRYALLQEIMHKTDLHGSIGSSQFSDDSVHLNFIVTKPGIRYDIQANLISGEIAIKELRFNKWGIARALHVMRNPTVKEQGDRYPSPLASVWTFTLDIVSVGLIVLCISGWYLWIKTPRKRFYPGLVAVACGSIFCIFYLLL